MGPDCADLSKEELFINCSTTEVTGFLAQTKINRQQKIQSLELEFERESRCAQL